MRVRRSFVALVATVLAVPLFIVAGATSAGAAVTNASVTYQCRAHPPGNEGSIIAEPEIMAGAIVTHPDFVDEDEQFTVEFAFNETVVPSEVSGITVINISNLANKFAVPANASFDSVQLLDSGVNWSGSVTSYITTDGREAVSLNTPGPYNANATFTLPTVEVTMTTTGLEGEDLLFEEDGLTTSATINLGIPVVVTTTCPYPPTPTTPRQTLAVTPIGEPAGNTPPTVDAGPNVSGDANTPIALDGTVTDPDDTPTTLWEIDDPGCSFDDDSAVDTTVTCTDDGSFTATLTADDGTNPPVADTTTVTVGDEPPPEPGNEVVLMTCDDVVNRAKIMAPGTARNVAEGVAAKSGIGFQTKDLQVAGIGHPEGVVADADPKATIKYEVDDWITPRAGYTADWFDSDTCSGLLTVSDQTAAVDAMIPDFSAAPWGPLYSSVAPEAPLGEIVKMAGKLTGRADCDPALPGDETSWTLQGKLTIQWAQGKSAGSDPVHLDAAGKKVATQVYLRVNPDDSLNVDLTMDTVGDTPDRVHLKGIVIKGVGNGSDFNSTGAYRPPFANLALAAEACSFNFDLTGDTVVGEKFGGLNFIVIDTDLDTFSDGTADPGTGLYDGEMVFSIPDGT